MKNRIPEKLFRRFASMAQIVGVLLMLLVVGTLSVADLSKREVGQQGLVMDGHLWSLSHTVDAFGVHKAVMLHDRECQCRRKEGK